jgi:hypothetical protein
MTEEDDIPTDYAIIIKGQPTIIPTRCAPDGQPCPRCRGIHNSQPGTYFVTSRRWDPDADDDEGQA